MCSSKDIKDIHKHSIMKKENFTQHHCHVQSVTYKLVIFRQNPSYTNIYFILYYSVQFNSVHIVRTTKIIATILSSDILRIRVESSLFSSRIKYHEPRDRSSIYVYIVCVNGILNEKTNVFTKLVLVLTKFSI